MKLLIALLLSVGFMAQAKTTSKMSLDLKKSKVNWFAKKVIGDDNHKGIIPIKTADIQLNNNGEVSKATIILDLTKFESTDLSGTYKKKFEKHLKSEDFFHVSKKGNETATIKIEKIEKSKATGKMTLKGVTKPIKLDFTKNGNTWKGSYTLDRTVWDIKYGSNNFFKGLGDKAIDDKVKIDFTIVGTKETATKKK